MAQFRIFPSSESRHSFVANYTSAVKFKIHILFLFCCITIPLYVSESKYLKVICLVKIITIFPHDPFYEGLFSHVSVSVHCMFPKNAFVWNAFLSNFRFQHVFQQLLKHIQEKTDLLSCFWFDDSRVIIVTVLPGFESCKHKFISRHITITYTRSAVCTT